MSSASSYLTIRIAHLFVIMILATPSVFSACLFPTRCSSRNIDAGTKQVNINVPPNYIDTLYRSDQDKALQTQFDSSGVCFLGMVDSVIRFRTGPFNFNGNCLNYCADSVHVNVIARYKGIVPQSYWFIDTITAADCDTTKPVWIEDGDWTLQRILGDRFIVFMNTAGNLRKAGMWGGNGCSEKSGYYIESNDIVEKWGLHQEKIPDSNPDVYIEERCVWFPMTLTEFLDALGVSTRAAHRHSSHREEFRIMHADGAVFRVAGSDRTFSIAMFTIDGKLLVTTTIRCRAGERFSLTDNVAGANSVQLIRITDGNSTWTIRHSPDLRR